MFYTIKKNSIIVSNTFLIDQIDSGVNCFKLPFCFNHFCFWSYQNAMKTVYQLQEMPISFYMIEIT